MWGWRVMGDATFLRGGFRSEPSDPPRPYDVDYPVLP